MPESDKPLEVRLNCYGYFGFGGGYVAATSICGPFYCNTCPLSGSCWDKHRTRVASIFPDASKEFDNLAAQMDGPLACEAWFIKHDCADPYTAVLGGNVEDGVSAAAGGRQNR